MDAGVIVILLILAVALVIKFPAFVVGLIVSFLVIMVSKNGDVGLGSFALAIVCGFAIQFIYSELRDHNPEQAKKEKNRRKYVKEAINNPYCNVCGTSNRCRYCGTCIHCSHKLGHEDWRSPKASKGQYSKEKYCRWHKSNKDKL